MLFGPNVIPCTEVDKDYSAIRDRECWTSLREYLERCWTDYECVCPDRDFKSKIQKKFSAMVWQMHLACLLKRAGRKLRKGDKSGPDTIVELEAGLPVSIENIVAENGNGPDAVIPLTSQPYVETSPGFKLYQGRRGPEVDDKILLRILNAIATKNKQYQRWVSRGKVSAEKPFVIAINAAQVGECCVVPEYSYGVRSVFAIGGGGWTVPLNLKDGTGKFDNSKPFIRPKPFATKINGKAIASDLFLNDQMKHLSAIIFTPHSVLSDFTHSGQDLELILNPFATSSVPPDLLGCGKVYSIEFIADRSAFLVNHQTVGQPK